MQSTVLEGVLVPKAHTDIFPGVVVLTVRSGTLSELAAAESLLLATLQ